MDTVLDWKRSAEGSPTTVVEVVAAGLRVVTAADGGTLEAIKPGTTGLLVPSNRLDLMAEAIQRLVDSPTELGSLGAAAKVQARDTCHIDGVIERLSRLYQSLLGRP